MPPRLRVDTDSGWRRNATSRYSVPGSVWQPPNPFLPLRSWERSRQRTQFPTAHPCRWTPARWDFDAMVVVDFAPCAARNFPSCAALSFSGERQFLKTLRGC